MKTLSSPRIILSLLSVGLLACSTASAQSIPSSLGVGGQHFLNKQQRQALVSNLSVAQKRQLHSAMKKVHDDPQLVAARQAIEDAQTKEAKQEAKSSLRTLRHDLLLKADPSLGSPAFKSVLDQIDATPGCKPTAQP